MKKKVMIFFGVLVLCLALILGSVQKSSADFCDVTHPDLPPPEDCKN